MRRDFVVVLGIVLAIEWLVPLFPRGTSVALDRAFMVFGFLWVLVSVYRARPLSVLGVRIDNIGYCLIAFFVPVLIVFGPYLLSREAAPRELPSLGSLGSYFFWALFQQTIAIGVFWRHYRAYFGLDDRGAFSPTRRGWGPDATQGVFSRANLLVAGATALTFSAVHAPNPGLVLLTLVAELVFVLLFQRFRNVFAVAAAHAAAALLAKALWVPSPWLPHFTVGLRFFRPFS